MSEYQIEYEKQRAARIKAETEQERHFRRFAAMVVTACVVGLAVLIGGLMWGLPKYKLYRADIEKRTLISEARAKAAAAEYTAEAEVTKAEYEADRDRIRAAGVADANKAIDSSLTDKFITWYYVDQISGESDQIIYVPTEGGVPLLEAGRVPMGAGVTP